jgi:hypothetical protein
MVYDIRHILRSVRIVLNDMPNTSFMVSGVILIDIQIYLTQI